MNIDKLITQFILSQPFLSVFAMRVLFNENNNIPTAATDGTTIEYNEKFMNALSNDERLFVMAHEFVHIFMMHHLRRQNRNIELWNMACDYEVNGMLYKAGFHVIDNALINYSNLDMVAEEIYEKLVKQNKNNNEFTNGKSQSNKDIDGNNIKDWNIGQVNDATKDGKGLSKSEIKKEKDKIKKLIEQATVIEEKKMGKGNGAFARSIEWLIKETLNYRAIMQRFFEEVERSLANWKRPNKKYIRQGLYLPRRGKKTLGDGVIAVDTSGSISVEELRKQISEIMGILSFFDINITVIYCDYKINGIDIINSNTDLSKLNPIGGGGTSFIPPFEWIKENNIDPSWFIYYTDGECNRFPDEPSYPVLWMLSYNNHSFKPPFGETIYISQVN